MFKKARQQSNQTAGTAVARRSCGALETKAPQSGLHQELSRIRNGRMPQLPWIFSDSGSKQQAVALMRGRQVGDVPVASPCCACTTRRARRLFTV